KIIEEAFNYFYMLISINDELKIFPEIISIIKDIEDQEPTIASTPKKLFLASINETSRFWLYHLLIKNNNVISFDYKNNELHEYIILEWDDFLHTPEELSIY
ncbi:TPA: hypothetical protein U2J86_005235, partial [Serratia marcescens]|nr:hypothetical protein [Serratia marcescens]